MSDLFEGRPESLEIHVKFRWNWRGVGVGSGEVGLEQKVTVVVEKEWTLVQTMTS